LQKISDSSELKDNIVNVAASLGAGFISKKIISGRSSSIIRSILATLTEFAVVNVVSQNTDKIKSVASTLFSSIFKKKDDNKKDKEESEA